MSKRSRKQKPLPEYEVKEARPPAPKKPTLQHLNRNQKAYSDLIESQDIVFATGAAGTGKTYIAAVHAILGYLSNRFEKIIITRPAIEAGGERIGFLPGGINEKMDPYIRPILDVFQTHIGAKRIKTMIEYGHLEVVPLAFMRGRTLRNCFIIADEMQNATSEQVLMLLTRLGEGSRMVLTGDPKQRDHNVNGFEVAKDRLQDVPAIGFIEFGKQDVVRHPTVEKVLHAWD